MGPRAGLDRCEKSRPNRDSIPGPSSPKPAAIPTELPGLPWNIVRLYILLAYVSTKVVEWRRMEWNDYHEHSLGTNLERDVVTERTKHNHVIRLERLRRFKKNIGKTYRLAEI